MNRIDITQYNPKSTDHFLFDNNVWVYIFSPIGNHNPYAVDKFSDFFGKVIDCGAKVYVPSIILSEFYNTNIRLDFNIWRNKEDKDFKKDYRPLERFKENSKLIVNSIESQILGVGTKLDDKLTEIKIEEISNRVEKLDFNDSYLVGLALMNNLKLVTNDKDFLSINDDIDILTLPN
jgi:predicted nucleic acid-binding protein